MEWEPAEEPQRLASVRRSACGAGQPGAVRGGLLAVRPRPAQAAPREGGRAERTAHTHLGAIAARRRRCSRSRGVYSRTGGGRPSFGRRTPPPSRKPSRDPGHLRVRPAGGALRPPRTASVPKAPGDLRQEGLRIWFSPPPSGLAFAYALHSFAYHSF